MFCAFLLLPSGCWPRCGRSPPRRWCLSSPSFGHKTGVGFPLLESSAKEFRSAEFTPKVRLGQLS